jgi:predicted nucleotide-binding protein
MNERGWWILVSIGFIVLIVVCIFGIIYLKSRRRRYQQSKKILKANNIEINIEKKKRKKLYKENSEDKHVIKTNFNRPKVFIGSSSEGEDVARAIQQELGKHCEPVIWDQNPYDPSARVTEELLKVGIEFDFAVLVLTADDLVKKRDVEGYAPRDNVIFELGFFMGCIGCERTFMIYPEDASLALPSDIHGLLRVKFKWPSKKKFLRAAVGPACTLILDRILGERIKL